MSRISPEKEIMYISKVIEKNIHYYDTILKDKGFLSENILSQLRNLVEDVVILINNKLNNHEYDVSYENINISFDEIDGIQKYKFLKEFHSYLQSTASHYTPNEDGAERLVKFYFRYICLIKKTLKDEFDINIINNIDLFPIYDDKSMQENYDLICKKIDSIDYSQAKPVSGKFYVEKCNTIFSTGDIYYEYTLTKATDYNNKFERLTFYSKIFIPDNYSINISSIDDIVDLNVGTVSIRVITWYKIAIRSCELSNLSKIMGNYQNIETSLKEYSNLMDYLTQNETTILNIVTLNNQDYDYVIDLIKNGGTNHKLSNLLTKIRDIIINNQSGSNIIRYLITKIVNTVIRDQTGDNPHYYLSNLYLHKKSSMFESMPYAMSLHNHNPKIFDLMKSIDCKNREDEMLYSFIKHNTEQKDILYTPLNEIGYFDNIPNLVDSFNSKLLSRIPDSKSFLVLDKDFLFIKEYEENSIKIIQSLKQYSSIKNKDLCDLSDAYFVSIQSDNTISADKKRIFDSIFKCSSLALIYGPAGTGKTKMIELLCNCFDSYNKCVISNTNTSITNLNGRLSNSNNINIMTISSFLKKYSGNCDILIVDESSMVSNTDMLNILNKMNYKGIILVGDVYQIEPIEYGNWFKLCSKYFNDGVSFELDMTHRTSDDDLKLLWNYVRVNDKHAINLMNNKEYSHIISEEIFNRDDDEEIILCLNYDGMYGINNINRVMQSRNPSKPYYFGVDTFKINDPILFNDCPRFSEFLTNNLKGIIKNIEDDKDSIWFTIEIDKKLVNIDKIPADLIYDTSGDKIFVRFKVNAYKDKDDDEYAYDHIIPFNLAYAISIHKAQGLEFNSVKIVITSNIEDRITKNIFYTAITRTRKKLNIYWNSDSEDKIFESFNQKNSTRDLAILSQKLKS